MRRQEAHKGRALQQRPRYLVGCAVGVMPCHAPLRLRSIPPLDKEFGIHSMRTHSLSATLASPPACTHSEPPSVGQNKINAIWKRDRRRIPSGVGDVVDGQHHAGRRWRRRGRKVDGAIALAHALSLWVAREGSRGRAQRRNLAMGGADQMAPHGRAVLAHPPAVGSGWAAGGSRSRWAGPLRQPRHN